MSPKNIRLIREAAFVTLIFLVHTVHKCVYYQFQYKLMHITVMERNAVGWYSTESPPLQDDVVHEQLPWPRMFLQYTSTLALQALTVLDNTEKKNETCITCM